MVTIKLTLKVPPGKTAPRLIEDVLRYDPLHPAKSGRHVVIDPAPIVEDGQLPPPDVVQGACRHKFMTKPAQSVPPPTDARPDTSTSYVVASFCVDCRIHVRLDVDYADHYQTTRSTERPCPNQDFPLHHFQLIPSKSSPRPTQLPGAPGGETWTEHHSFECSSPTCSAAATVTIKSPRLTSRDLSLLVDEEAIALRVQPVLDAFPDRLAGYTVPKPIRILGTLKAYLADSMRDVERKKVNSTNKRFLTTLGEGCLDLLHRLGFEYVEAAAEEPPQYWSLPEVKTSSDGALYQDELSVLVDDVEKELMVLIDAQAKSQPGLSQTTVKFHPLPSIKDFERCLGCQDYDKLPSARRAVDLTVEEHPYHASLGALADFSDELISFSYERQRLCDPDNAPYYLDCLQQIARTRNSETLTTKAVLMESAGEISGRDVLQAYQYFQIDPKQPDLSDDYIIGCFQSRASASPLQIEAARQQLRVIGISRHSGSIESVASNRISTYEQALVWLGAENGTPDDFILSLITSKMTENDQDAELCRHAVSLIAEKRDSFTLRTWLNTGRSGGIEMDIGQAYSRLGITDRTVDDDLIMTTFEIRASEAPEQGDELRAALAAIGNEKGSEKINGYLRTGKVTDHVSADWPVGLENIGNTCYLNSLLQFYFTVKPLRDLILNFHEYEMDTSPENLKRKRVGSRKVTLKEIERAKKFAYELQKLFRALITAQASAIAPARELARLTLIKSSDEEDYRRRSTVSQHNRPGLGELNGAPIHGPIAPPTTEDTMEVDSGPAEHNDNDSAVDIEHEEDGSETTLVDQPPSYEETDTVMKNAEDSARPDGKHYSNSVLASPEQKRQQGKVLDDKENHPPSKSDGVAQPSQTLAPSEPLKPTSESRTNEQGGSVEASVETGDPTDAVMITSDPLTPSPELSPPQPDRAPPVPPRPKQAAEPAATTAITTSTTTTTSKPIDELELGAQQDVTEVIGNVLFQLECAMRADGVDDRSGEQQDEIKRLFYGRSKAHIEARDGPRINEEYFADIKINVADGPRDIYQALDGAFDVQEISLEYGTYPQYTSISQLPPVLQIHVQRVQYDKESKKMYKSDSHLKLRETIHLDRYMDSEDPSLLEKRRQTWRWKEEVSRLEGRRAELTKTEVEGLSVPDLLELTGEWINDVKTAEDAEEGEKVIGDNVTVLEALRRRADETRRELNDIDTQIQTLNDNLANQFSDLQSLPYRLQSVFIHRGTATFGHYWIYIYDFPPSQPASSSPSQPSSSSTSLPPATHTGRWLKYNDTYVTSVPDPEIEIFSQDERYPATPYYLVYVRADMVGELCGSICRDVPSQPDDGAAAAAAAASGAMEGVEGTAGNWPGASVGAENGGKDWEGVGDVAQLRGGGGGVMSQHEGVRW